MKKCSQVLVVLCFGIHNIGILEFSGSETQLGNLTFVPLRDGPNVWEIGFPDRTAIGYFVPDVNPIYVNKLFLYSPEK